MKNDNEGFGRKGLRRDEAEKVIKTLLPFVIEPKRKSKSRKSKKHKLSEVFFG